MKQRTSYRVLLAITGLIAVGLGTVGVFVPLLPTTPFLLLAAACFLRSSDRLYAWLMHHRWFGAYIRNYREHRAITRRAKVVTLALLWGVIGYSAVAVATAWWLRALLGAVAVGVTLHLLGLKTLDRDMLESCAGINENESAEA
ncbi:MAG: YbaN family protein [Kiritimatiellae bacterium]|nr:YbaN family protein [Kiritimatiellia bacterium]